MKKQQLKTTSIKGRQYVEVHERLKYFREHFPEYALITEIIELTPERIVLNAKVLNKHDRVVADGLAYEEKGSSYINKTSYIENAQTSAWGRALANFGIGIDSSVASADEVAIAVGKQELPQVTTSDLYIKAIRLLEGSSSLQELQQNWGRVFKQIASFSQEENKTLTNLKDSLKHKFSEQKGSVQEEYLKAFQLLPESDRLELWENHGKFEDLISEQDKWEYIQKIYDHMR